MLKNKALLFLIIFSSILTFSQSIESEKELYKWFDTTVGFENSGLLDGIAYKELYKTNNDEHQFYRASSFQKGNVSYNGQSYFDVDIKYDIYNDGIIVKVPTQTITRTIQLIKENVHKFSIKNSEFIRLKEGFYEVIFKADALSLYKKHKKTSTKYYSGRLTFYRFNESKTEYLLYFNNEYHKITKSKKSLTKLLPKYKNEISVFYKSQKELLNTNHDLFMKNLIIDLNDTILNNAHK